jgi:hypothetical protein
MIGYGIANRTEVLRGLGRFAPVTARSSEGRSLVRPQRIGSLRYGRELVRSSEGMRKFLEDWVASLQLRPRIGQKF